MSSRLAPRCLVLLAAAAGAAWGQAVPRPDDPDVAVHVVERRPAPDQGRVELTLYPVVPVVNGRFTDHLGTLGAVTWHLQERFALQLTGGGNWLTAQSAFDGELATRAQVAAPAAASLLWTWGLLGGVEVTPLYGKLAFLEDGLAHFGVVLSGAAGLGGTRHQLKPATVRADGVASAASYGDTGLKLLGSLGAGLRVTLGEHLALRLEVRDVITSARVDHVNGCAAGDLQAMEGQLQGGLPLEGAKVGPGCDLQAFLGRTPAGDPRSADVSLAARLVQGEGGQPSAEVLNFVGVYLGISFQF